LVSPWKGSEFEEFEELVDDPKVDRDTFSFGNMIITFPPNPKANNGAGGLGILEAGNKVDEF